MDLNVPIFILANKRKKLITTDYLRGINYTVLWNKDMPLMPDQKLVEHHSHLTGNTLADYRCFKGHERLAEEMLIRDCHASLVLEDDAEPVPGWEEIVNDAAHNLLGEYEIVSLHGRAIKTREEIVVLNGRQYVQPGWMANKFFPYRWVNGTLAYLISRNGMKKLFHSQYEGVPIDLHLATNFKYICLQPEEACFIHRNIYGSFYDKVSTDERIREERL